MPEQIDEGRLMPRQCVPVGRQASVELRQSGKLVRAHIQPQRVNREIEQRRALEVPLVDERDQRVVPGLAEISSFAEGNGSNPDQTWHIFEKIGFAA